jgi:alpha-beta hydrolase superfamily lysophospholipase
MISLLDHPSISGKYLFPQNRKLKRPFVVRVNNVELACFQRIVDNSGFTLIHFHGNGEAVADYVPFMADVFEDMGLNQLFVEYRAYGGSSGEAKLVAMLADGEAVMQAAGISESDVRAEVAKHFNHQSKLSGYTNPLLILHAENDRLIDMSHAERNEAWAGSKYKRLVRFPNGDHNTIFPANMNPYIAAVKEFVEGLGR